MTGARLTPERPRLGLGAAPTRRLALALVFVALVMANLALVLVNRSFGFALNGRHRGSNRALLAVFGVAMAGVRKANRKDLLVMRLAEGAAVAGVIAAARRSRSMLRVDGSMSTKTTRAPTCKITLEVATHVIGVVMTSSPGPMPSASSARCSPAVAELTAIACRPGSPASCARKAAKSASNCLARGPVGTQIGRAHV